MGLLRNLRKTECGAIGYWLGLAVRVASFALVRKLSGTTELVAAGLRRVFDLGEGRDGPVPLSRKLSGTTEPVAAGPRRVFDLGEGHGPVPLHTFINLLDTFINLKVAGWLGLALFTLAAPASAQTPVVGGSSTCTLASLSGSYGTAVSGFSGTVPVATYGSFTANGNGSLTGSALQSVGGVISTVSTSGTYTMTSGCTGTAVFKDSLGDVSHFAFTMNSNGSSVDFVETDSGNTNSGVVQPLAANCNAASFSGPYIYEISGWLATGSSTDAPYTEAGRIVADGNGHLTGKSTYSSAGTAERRTLSGTYSIGSGCTGTMSFTDSLGNSGTLAITIVNSGQQALFLNTAAGTAIAGRAYRGQSSCNSSTALGSYQYAVNGFVISSGVVDPIAYSGMLTINANGTIQGADDISEDGLVRARTYSATYSVNSDCSGSEVLQDSLGDTADLDFFLTDQGGQIEFINTNAGFVLSGTAQQVASGTCTNATINGAYGYALQGWYDGLDAIADAGQYTADGAGHFTGASTVSYDGDVVPTSFTGTYQINANCTGTSTFTSSAGSSHYYLTVTPNGQRIESVDTDSGSTITEVAQYEFAQPSAAIVNGGSFAPNAIAPGSLFSIFGTGLAPAVAEASGVWPTQLGTTQVLVNGVAAPVYYVSSEQIDAQLPVNLAPGTAQLVVSVGGVKSAAVNFTVAAAAPGILTYGALRAIAVDFSENTTGILVGPSTPALPGDVLVVYLTGGGPVQPSGGTWTTGALAPPGVSPVTLPYSVTIGGLPATVAYLGLTTGFIGLYQLNVQVPALPAGDSTLVITVNGQASSSALVSIAQ